MGAIRKRMWLAWLGLMVLQTVVIWGACSTVWAESTETHSPSLTEVVLFGLRPVSELKPSLFDGERKQCVESYRQTVSPQSVLWRPHDSLRPDLILAARRQNLEFQIVSILGPDSAEEAAEFSRAVPLAMEWEGMSEGPLEEVNLAQQWLEHNPKTPLSPFLHLFMAHRLRAAYECSRTEHSKGLWPIVAERYHEQLEAAQGSDNRLIVCIAKDLEALDYVYLPGFEKP